MRTNKRQRETVTVQKKQSHAESTVQSEGVELYSAEVLRATP